MRSLAVVSLATLCLDASASGLTVAGSTGACIEVIDSGRFDAAQVYYNAINPSAAWALAPRGWRSQDFSGVIAACKRQNMGILNIRVFAGGALARERPGRLAVLISGTDADNEVRCATALRTWLGNAYGNAAQTALRALDRVGAAVALRGGPKID